MEKISIHLFEPSGLYLACSMCGEVYLNDTLIPSVLCPKCKEPYILASFKTEVEAIEYSKRYFEMRERQQVKP